MTGRMIGAMAIALCATALPTAHANAQQPTRVQAGLLRCDVSAGIGQIIGSTRSLSCVFERLRGHPERYRGIIRHAGLDIGATSRGVMVWGVLAPSQVRRGALAGRHAGTSAEVTAGLGVGANVLLGGSANSIALQPVSVQAQLGLNIAVGVAELTLERVRRRQGVRAD
jgi:hypothetical protein